MFQSAKCKIFRIEQIAKRSDREHITPLMRAHGAENVNEICPIMDQNPGIS